MRENGKRNDILIRWNAGAERWTFISQNMSDGRMIECAWKNYGPFQKNEEDRLFKKRTHFSEWILLLFFFFLGRLFWWWVKWYAFCIISINSTENHMLKTKGSMTMQITQCPSSWFDSGAILVSGKSSICSLNTTKFIANHMRSMPVH